MVTKSLAKKLAIARSPRAKFIGYGTYNTSTHVVTLPVGTLAGDQCIMAYTGAINPAAISGGTGQASWDMYTMNVSFIATTFFWKSLSSADIVASALTLTGAATFDCVLIAVYRCAGLQLRKINPTVTRGASPTGYGFTKGPQHLGVLALYIDWENPPFSSLTPPAGFTDRGAVTGATQYELKMADRLDGLWPGTDMVWTNANNGGGGGSSALASFEVTGRQSTGSIESTPSLPQMTSNVAPVAGYTAFYQNTATVPEETINTANHTGAYQVFDSALGSGNVEEATAPTAWGRSYPTAQIIGRYGMRIYYGTYDVPLSWSFEGSQDGVKWDFLHCVDLTIAGESTGWTFGVTRYFDVPRASWKPYLYHRLNVKAVGSSHGFGLMNLFDLELRLGLP